MFSFRLVTTVNDKENGIPKTAYTSGNDRGFALFDMSMIIFLPCTFPFTLAKHQIFECMLLYIKLFTKLYTTKSDTVVNFSSMY